MNLNRYKFSYGSAVNMTVTIMATHYELAVQKACSALDRRYERQNKEPPVGWTLELFEFTHHTKLK